jgi:hypothetical protein
LESVIEKLIDFSAGKDDELRDISGLGSPGHFNGSPYILTDRSSSA